MKRGRGEAIAGEAEALFGPEGVGFSTTAAEDIHGDLVNHGVAFGVNVTTPREDGSRIDFEHRAWPIELRALGPSRALLQDARRSDVGASRRHAQGPTLTVS